MAADPSKGGGGDEPEIEAASKSGTGEESEIEAASAGPPELSELLRQLAEAPPAEVDASAARPLVAGDRVGKFELVREIGRGGFGVVYQARDLELQRPVAFKALRQKRRLLERGEDWLRREAEAVARLQHPAIVTLHDFGRGPSGPFLIFELLRGETLHERLRRGPIPARQAIRVAIETARALEHAHAQGVVHRDLKPSNIFLCDDGSTKVLDFGLARLFERADARSGGSPAYMAPEQWRGEPEDARTDLFGLGATLHEALEGRPPYRADPRHSAVLDPGPVPRLSPEAGQAPLRHLVARMIEKDPERRPSGAGEVRAGLEEMERRRARRPLVAVGALAAAALALWLLWPPRPEGRVTVAVADVVNDAGERDLDGLSGLIATSLEASRRLDVVPRADLAERIGRPGGPPAERVDERSGLEAARQAGARVLLVPAVRRENAGYAISAKAIDPRTREVLFSLEEAGSGREALPELVDRLSARVRSRLRERDRDIRQTRVRVVEAATGQLEAYRAYFEAEQILARGAEDENVADDDEALHLYGQAVQLDPGFALAHYRMAQVLWHVRRDAGAAIGRAREHMGGATPKDRAAILALDAFIGGRIDEALRRYREMARDFASDKEVHLALAELLASREGGRDFAGAAQAARRAVEAAPRSAAAWKALLDAERYQGRLDLVAEAGRRYVRAVPSTSSYSWLGWALFNLGRTGEAEQVFSQAAELLGPAGLEGLGGLHLAAGDAVQAEAVYRRLAAHEDPAAVRGGQFGLSWASAARGRFREAAERLEEVIRGAAKSRDAAGAARALGQQALWLTLARGRLAEEPIARGRALLRAPRSPAVVQRHFFWFAVEAALAAGRLDVAEDLEREAAAQGSTHTAPLLRMARLHREGRDGEARREAEAVRDPSDPTYGFHLPLAEWALEAGRLDEALAAADRALSLPLWPHADAVGYQAYLVPRALLERARIQIARGERAAARADLDRLLAQWREAEPEAPAVFRARALRRQLGGR